MRAFKGISALALAAVIGTAGTAYAGEGHENSREVAAAVAAKTTLSQAIAIAERQGGRGVKGVFKGHDGDYVYKIKLLANDGTVSEVSVNPASGAVSRTETEGFFSRIFGEDDDADALKQHGTSTTLVDAIAIAEREAGGKAIAARYDTEHEQALLRVAVVKDQVVRDVTIDAANGKVTNIGTARDDEQDSD